MRSLALMIASFLGMPFLFGIGVQIPARALGSERANVRTGLLVGLVLTALNVASSLVWVGLGTGSLAGIGSAMVIQMGGAYAVAKRAFRLSWVQALVPLGAYLAALVACTVCMELVVKRHVLDGARAVSRAMTPAVEPGDRFFICRFCRPKRWDVVAYESAEEPDKRLLHRVVGLPGERLRFEGGKLFVDDVETPGFPGGPLSAGYGRSFPRYRDGETIVLESGEYFVLGDNVSISADSRVKGPVESRRIVGVVDLVWWPPRRFKVLR